MKKSDLKPGTKVLASIENDYWEGATGEIVPYVHDEYDEYTLVGVVRSREASSGKVWVKWIEGFEDLAEEESEVDVKILTLESDRSKIEQEFKSTSKEIQVKMKEAAKLIKESNLLAKKVHAKHLADMHDAVSPLISAMDDSGWRSSSWGC